jgi:type I restriction enzyme R subunit
MNLNEKGKYITTDKEFRKEFHSNRYNILVVANKYQTGFDEPLLHSMYVDKKLKDVTAVQTLSRLNRTCPGKTNTFVMDFENTSEDIKQAFDPYYTQTVLEGNTDLNKVYDYRAKINDYMLYNFDDVNKFYELMDKEKDKKQNPGTLGKLAAMFKPVVTRYSELLEEQRYTYRDYLRGFNNTYSYVTQIK